MSNEEDGGPAAAAELLDALPGTAAGAGSAPAGFVPAFSLDRRTSGSIIPKRAEDRSAGFVAACGNAAELVFDFTTLHTSPFTRLRRTRRSFQPALRCDSRRTAGSGHKSGTELTLQPQRQS